MGLFERGFIGNLELSNRFIRSATAEFAASEDGTVTPAYFSLYSQLAKGEVGLIIQGHLYVVDEGKAHDKMAGISQDYHLPGLKRIVQMVQQADTGSVIAAQLNHGGAHSVSTKAPSLRDDKAVRLMNDEDIEQIITGYRNGAKRAQKVGYAAIQIHAAHGYLLSQFLSSKTNRRTDSWGGSLENRAQFLLSVYQEIRLAVGVNFPVLAKINGSDNPHEGFLVEDSCKVVEWLADAGLDAIEISGMQSSRKIKKDEEGYFIANARIIKQHIGDLPLSVVGGFRTVSMMKKVQDEFAEFISLCRPFIREPDLVQKLKAGKKRVDCISCNRCLDAPNIITCLAKKDET
ncbi:MAG: NADH:flavin oxidoreductase [Candidatus Hodarchaeota archaeon]